MTVPVRSRSGRLKPAWEIRRSEQKRAAAAAKKAAENAELLERLAVKYPSVLWGEREWHAVLRADVGIYHHLLESMALAITPGRKIRKNPQRSPHTYGSGPRVPRPRRSPEDEQGAA